ncbi:PAQR family membrane homeostasis protein TrhA [[Clostridium] polysaccharolyticum]|jgi:hemolysin III|uniref:Hemolysin III n=1 Tax=[Clostridium] polysaccharolyticum TaxID=29364 RepID=A0A1I0BN97_9FIRM|nr:hemolysin III family protein [[Clostridium] polysaccharolyticum]SET08423.1 hemolysin III [[Clostridium] polysaccharolyticum]
MKETRKLKDPGSAITHFIGMLMAIFAATPLLMKASRQPDRIHIVTLSIFIASMILLYAASTIYHSFDINPRINKLLKKMDHLMIFILIAGSYTPICLIVVRGNLGLRFLILIWSLALSGIIIKMFWINCPKCFSSCIYIAMGWACVLCFTPIINNLTAQGLGWLITGGIIYTIGGIIYAIKLPAFDLKHKNFGLHEIFHLFVMGGSVCHFILMYQFVSSMPL